MADHELIVVGDRIFTDIVLANRMQGDGGPLSIWTTGVWEPESLFVRWMEKKWVDATVRWSTPPNGRPTLDTAKFVKNVALPETPKNSGCIQDVSSIFRR